jgi:hypothetical protein
MKLTAIHDVITAVVATLDAAATYPVYDGPISNRPGNTVDRYVIIGAEELTTGEGETPTNSATMDQTWYGLGQPAREENLNIECIAVAKAKTVALARGIAFSLIQDTFNSIGTHPSTETFNALVSGVTSVRSRNVSGGAVVYIQFTISASARLT